MKDKKEKRGKKGALEQIIEQEENESADLGIKQSWTSRANPVSDGEMAPPGTPEPADIHPGSPAACKTPGDRFSYLQQLSNNQHYRELLDMVDMGEVR